MSEADVFNERVATNYESWYNTREGRRADRLEKASLEGLLSCFPHARRLLEIGCGTAHFTRWLSAHGLRAIGLDLSRAMLSEAGGFRQVPLVQADAHRLPFEDDAFDLSAFITTLEFLEAPERALAEAVRVASQGILLGVLNRCSALAVRRRLMELFRPSVYDGARFYTVGELEQLLHEATTTVLGETESQGAEVVWHTTLFPPWMPWERAELPLGGFIAAALIFQEKARRADGPSLQGGI